MPVCWTFAGIVLGLSIYVYCALDFNRLSPIQCYEVDLKKEGFQEDEAQRNAVEHMQRLFDDLCRPIIKKTHKKSIFNMLVSSNAEPAKLRFKGVYFWGGVGRGKTYIVDTFFNCLPFTEKTRIHFHSFMRGVHQELKTLNNVQDPLKVVADRYAEKFRVICFDEFHVSDITDAMLLGNLFKELFSRGVTLVATSNEHPDELYTGGLQRDRFLPAIALIKQHTDIVNVDSDVDYRYRLLEKAEIYHWPLGYKADESLSDSFYSLISEESEPNNTISIEGRSIETIKHSIGIVWFEFSAICDGPRGASDYIEIARTFQTVLISNVPIMNNSRDDNTKRFMTMIDEFYDRNVKIILSAETLPENLYTGVRLSKGFKRTVSRLQEMGSKDYLTRKHIYK